MKNGLYPEAFRERAPWWGGDLQTLRNRFVGDQVTFSNSSTRLYFPMSDGSGDRLSGMLEVPENDAGGPLVVIIHGLTGCEDSIYVRTSAAFYLQRGLKVLRLNLRGAGLSRKTCKGFYHSGCTRDIQDVLEGLDASLVKDGVFLIGYSLGGNILLNFLGARSCGVPIVGAATISAPIEPLQTCLRIMERRNVLYHRWLLNNMKRDALMTGTDIRVEEREAVHTARSVYEFDDLFIAPRHGYRGADDYYSRTAGARVVKDIEVPLVMVHARNDPWIPVGPYVALQGDVLGSVDIVLTPGGGHVGFHGQGAFDAWHDRYVGAFVDELMNVEVGAELLTSSLRGEVGA